MRVFMLSVIMPPKDMQISYVYFIKLKEPSAQNLSVFQQLIDFDILSLYKVKLFASFCLRKNFIMFTFPELSSISSNKNYAVCAVPLTFSCSL